MTEAAKAIFVIPAKAGIQPGKGKPDFRLRGNDE